jgi:signal peptidase
METKKKIKLFGKILFYTVFVALFLIVVGMLVSKISNKVFFIGNRATIWVMSDSMEQEIPAQSYIVIRKADVADVKVGDVITFYSDDPMLQGHLNTHRVVEISDDGRYFTTKGDNNLIEDKYPVRAESVVGIYEKNLDLLSIAGRIFQSRTGIVVILIAMAALTFYSLGSDLFKKNKKESREGTSDE